MSPHIVPPSPSPTLPPTWRHPGVDFDQDGTRSTLQELLNLGGFFPLARIRDRIPFPPSTLRRWARAFPDFGTCIITIRTTPQGRTALTLIDLNRLEAALCARILSGAPRTRPLQSPPGSAPSWAWMKPAR